MIPGKVSDDALHASREESPIGYVSFTPAGPRTGEKSTIPANVMLERDDWEILGDPVRD
jgi:hypothetical protein